MKKILSVILCALMLLSVLPFTAFAAEEINFTVRIAKETDNELELTLDFDGGQGFAALDIDIEYNKVKLSLKTCKKGDGYVAFENYLKEENALSICSINVNNYPVKVSMANILEYKKVGGKKPVLHLIFSKAQGETFEKDDVTFDFTNCQTSSFENIKINLGYDLEKPKSTVTSSSSSSQGETTLFPQQPSEDNPDNIDSETGEAVEDDKSGESAQQNDGEPSQPEEKPNTTVIVLIVAGVAVAVGVVAFFLFKSKKKEKSEE